MKEELTQEDLQCLTFRLGEEIFAVDIARVREVLEFTTVTRVPRMPEYMCGVINLRGHVVPVVDLRLKFGMTSAAKTVDTCIIILEVAVEGDSLVLGALVDSVKEVITLDRGQVEPPPRMGTRLRSDFIRGMGRQGESFIIILNADRVFSADELSGMQQGGAEVAA